MPTSIILDGKNPFRDPQTATVINRLINMKNRKRDGSSLPCIQLCTHANRKIFFFSCSRVRFVCARKENCENLLNHDMLARFPRCPVRFYVRLWVASCVFVPGNQLSSPSQTKTIQASLYTNKSPLRVITST